MDTQEQRTADLRAIHVRSIREYDKVIGYPRVAHDLLQYGLWATHRLLPRSNGRPMVDLETKYLCHELIGDRRLTDR